MGQWLPNIATILSHVKLAIQVSDQGEYRLLKNILWSNNFKKQEQPTSGPLEINFRDYENKRNTHAQSRQVRCSSHCGFPIVAGLTEMVKIELWEKTDIFTCNNAISFKSVFRVVDYFYFKYLSILSTLFSKTNMGKLQLSKKKITTRFLK